MVTKKVTETKKLCDICGTDQNVYQNCCICGKEICYNCKKAEMFIPTSIPCKVCWEKYPFLEAIRKKYIGRHYALGEKEAKEMLEKVTNAKKQTKKEKKQ